MTKINLILLAVICFGIYGCSGLGMNYEPSGACVEGESVILKVTGGNPTQLGKALLMVNFAGLEAGEFTKDDVNEVLDSVTKLMDGTYASLIDGLNSRVISALLVIGTDLDDVAYLGGKKIVSDCDRQLIEAHIAHQRKILALY